jgi:glycosyltransferase involved in cell wall biosynthesis
MISFIVPAHNEEAWIGRCVSAIRNGTESLGEPHEIIVVDDASSDTTASIARQQGAQVVRVEHRQIAATRNTGAQQAHGDILFFVDADTLTNGPAIQSALRAHSFLTFARLTARLIFLGSRGFRSRKGLDYWV